MSGELAVEPPKSKRILRALRVYGPLRRCRPLVRYYRRLSVLHERFTVSDDDIRSACLVPEKALRKKFREALIILTEAAPLASLGDYFEFGVYNGTSLSCMYKVASELGSDGMRFFGFDSFEGLPKGADMEDDGIWTPGRWRCPIEVTRASLTDRGVDWNRTFLVEGWFHDTLTERCRIEHQMEKASIVMIDCDLYSSTVDALRFIRPLIRNEAVLLFDDWYSSGLDEKNLGEKRAFGEFLDSNPGLIVTNMGSYSDNSQVFHVRRTDQDRGIGGDASTSR